MLWVAFLLWQEGHLNHKNNLQIYLGLSSSRKKWRKNWVTSEGRFHGKHLWRRKRSMRLLHCFVVVVRRFVDCVGRPAHQDSAGNFASHVANDKDMYERGSGEKATFRYDYSDLGEDEVKRLTSAAIKTVRVQIHPPSTVWDLKSQHVCNWCCAIYVMVCANVHVWILCLMCFMTMHLNAVIETFRC